MIGGSVTLASSSPFDDPVIDPALLASPLDTAILVEGFMSARRLMTSIGCGADCLSRKHFRECVGSHETSCTHNPSTR